MDIRRALEFWLTAVFIVGIGFVGPIVPVGNIWAWVNAIVAKETNAELSIFVFVFGLEIGCKGIRERMFQFRLNLSQLQVTKFKKSVPDLEKLCY